jgi:hypothetical protein
VTRPDRRTGEDIAVPDENLVETVIEGVAESLPGGGGGPSGRNEDEPGPGDPRIDRDPDQTPPADEIASPG